LAQAIADMPVPQTEDDKAIHVDYVTRVEWISDEIRRELERD
jgi:hypothetical protein